MHRQQLISALSHVLWRGGSPCAGKTSIADHLARTHDLQVYHFDRTEIEHIARRIAEGDQALAAFLMLSMDQRWLVRAPQVMAQSVIGFWTERFRQVIHAAVTRVTAHSSPFWKPDEVQGGTGYRLTPVPDVAGRIEG